VAEHSVNEVTVASDLYQAMASVSVVYANILVSVTGSQASITEGFSVGQGVLT